MHRRVLQALTLLSVLILTGTTAQGAQPTRSEIAPATTASKAVYYSIRPDYRRCIAPLCGGYFIKPVNRRAMRCADGVRRSECYVAEIPWNVIGLAGDPDAALVLGDHQRRNFPGFGHLGILLPQAAWRAAGAERTLATDAHPSGRWYGLRSTSIVCVAAPCYNIKERYLNRTRAHLISDVDLSKVDADDLDAAMRLLREEELIAVGKNVLVPDQGAAGDGITMVAKDFFLPVKARRDDPLYCESDRDCTVSVYHSPVNAKDECYCPLCPQPIGAAAAKENQAGWRRHCGDFGFSLRDDRSATLICPQVLCVAPAPVRCGRNNQCVSWEPWPLPLLDDQLR